jgi:hypothetical protein
MLVVERVEVGRSVPDRRIENYGAPPIIFEDYRITEADRDVVLGESGCDHPEESDPVFLDTGTNS